MKFERYQHVERLGSVEVDGILDGIVHVFSKLDGSNTSVYLNDAGDMEVASRNRVLDFDNDNQGVCKYVWSESKFKAYLEKHPNRRLFGEWLVPHHIRNYEDWAWRRLYIFDVVEENPDGSTCYLSYDEYQPELEKFGIAFIPRICTWHRPTTEQIDELKELCKFLVKDGERGEGIVIKNYNFVNRFGRTVWAKIVCPIAKAAIQMHKTITGAEVEQAIVDYFVTPELTEKEYSKIVNDNGGFFSGKDIPKFLGVMWYTLITEEIFNILRKFKNPKIDFGLLRKLTIAKIKDIKSEVFAK